MEWVEHWPFSKEEKISGLESFFSWETPGKIHPDIGMSHFDTCTWVRSVIQATHDYSTDRNYSFLQLVESYQSKNDNANEKQQAIAKMISFLPQSSGVIAQSKRSSSGLNESNIL